MTEQNAIPETDCLPPDAPRPAPDRTGEDAQDAARSRRVEDAIYRRARGYKVAVRKTYKVKRVEYDPETGKKTCEREELQTGTDEVVVPADVRACAYWLVNRAPARWQEHPAPDAAADAAVGGTVDFPELKQPDACIGGDVGDGENAGDIGGVDSADGGSV